MPRAFFSVSDKTGIIEFAQQLTDMGWDIVATGGTGKSLSGAGIPVTPVEQLTGQPEMLGGRVKTLHPAVHAAILARDEPQDFAELQRAGYTPIDLVVVNLYPFQQTIAQMDVTLHQAVEEIDIGGVALLRAAAKNFERVTVVVDITDYHSVIEALQRDGRIPREERRRLAAKAFAHTRDYDTAIQSFLAGDDIIDFEISPLPAAFSLNLLQTHELRYGENPHQKAGLFMVNPRGRVLGGEVVQGKTLSYNNLLDADAAWQCISAFPPDEGAAAVIIKHLNPIGIAVDTDIKAAFGAALATDPVSAFGGIIAVNRTVDEEFAEALGTLFVEVLVAPSFSAAARERLQSERKNCRLLQISRFDTRARLEIRSIHGGILVQERDLGDPPTAQWECVTRRTPTAVEMQALRFAWKAVSYARSNAIVLTGVTATRGIGAGLPSRVDAVELAIKKAGERSQGAVMGSDAFFPFADGVQLAAAAGVTAVIQPGGSIRDQEVIEAANAAQMAMVFTHVRHFRH